VGRASTIEQHYICGNSKALEHGRAVWPHEMSAAPDYSPDSAARRLSSGLDSQSRVASRDVRSGIKLMLKRTILADTYV
jgi:hypothetical protein